MFFSRAVLVVFKNTGGKRWHGRDGLQPLSGPQQRNRTKNVEQNLKNLSVLKLAAAHEPPVPTRLYKPLNWWRQMWMKRKLESAKTVLGWDAQNAKLLAPGGGGGRGMLPTSIAARAAAPAVSVSFETRVQALAKQLQERSQQPAVASNLVHR